MRIKEKGGIAFSSYQSNFWSNDNIFSVIIKVNFEKDDIYLTIIS